MDVGRVPEGRAYYASLCTALGATALVQGWYLLTHPFPAIDGGLFLRMAEEIVAHGGTIPSHVRGHTAGGIPFAYPPLGLFIIGILTELSLDGITVLRVGAPIVVLGVVGAIYHLTLVAFADYRIAAVAGIVTGTTVPLNAFLIAGGGFVRGLGYLFMLVALVGAYRRFAGDGGRRSFGLATAGWTLAVLTHPVHAAAAGIGIFGAWLVWDRSMRGFVVGAGIAAAGLALASPWWVTVALQHGVDVFVTGAGSHGSLNTPADVLASVVTLWRFLPNLGWPVVLMLLIGVLLVLSVGARLVARGDWRCPVWLVLPVIALVPPHRRLALLVVAPLGAVGVVGIADHVGDFASSPPGILDRRLVTLGVLAAILVPFVAANLIAVGGHAPGDTLPTYVDAADREAMDWLEAETPRDAGIAVIGGANEWVPHGSNRTSVVTQYGTEWVGRDAWDRHRTTQARLADCESASCVQAVLSEAGFADSVDYLWVPRGEFVSNRRRSMIPPALHESLRASERFGLAFENTGAAVYRYEPAADPPSVARP